MIKYAPFTKEEVENLQKWQNSAKVHPFTCESSNIHPNTNLVPTVDGWVCPHPKCGITQNWCHDFMLDGAALQSIESFQLKFNPEV
jgi:hypothetical protein